MTTSHPNLLAEALALLTKVEDPDLNLLTREFNLWLDTVLIRGHRSHFSPTDLTCLFHRMHDIAQVHPLPPGLGAVETQKFEPDLQIVAPQANDGIPTIPFAPKAKVKGVSDAS